MSRIVWPLTLIIGWLTIVQLAVIGVQVGWTGVAWVVLPAMSIVLLVLTVTVVWRAGVRRLADSLTRGIGAQAYITGTSPRLQHGLRALPYIDELGVDVTPDRLPPALVLLVRPGYLELWAGRAREPRMYLRLPSSDVADVRPTADGRGVEVIVRATGPDPRQGELAFDRYRGHLGLRHAGRPEVVRDVVEIIDVLGRPAPDPLPARNGRSWRAIRAQLNRLRSLDQYELDTVADILDVAKQSDAADGRAAAIASEISERLGVDLDERIISGALAAAAK